MTDMQKERFNARNITKTDLERADKIIREQDYNYKVNLSTLYQLRSLINDEVRNAEDKKEAFYQAIEQHDNRVFKRPENSYSIPVGGQPIQVYLEVLRKIKSLGGTEFDEYWSEN
jgi:1-aminocyclopropane-1-carboxylate deaminase/D-cysteine desulfhydrase-like pyridoxal-dependent ACC family enzyme